MEFLEITGLVILVIFGGYILIALIAEPYLHDKKHYEDVQKRNKNKKEE